MKIHWASWRARIGLIVFAAFFAAPLPVEAKSLIGKVVKVSDGDTFTLLDSENSPIKIRLLGIDAPEKAQGFGQKSKEALLEKVAGKEVRVEVRKKDRYGRQLGKVWLGREDVNLSQVKTGMAWHYEYFKKDQFKGDAPIYAEAQKAAREARLGLWKEIEPISPWAFREAKKEASRKRRLAAKKPKSD